MCFLQMLLQLLDIYRGCLNEEWADEHSVTVKMKYIFIYVYFEHAVYSILWWDTDQHRTFFRFYCRSCPPSTCGSPSSVSSCYTKCFISVSPLAHPSLSPHSPQKLNKNHTLRRCSVEWWERILGSLHTNKCVTATHTEKPWWIGMWHQKTPSCKAFESDGYAQDHSPVQIGQFVCLCLCCLVFTASACNDLSCQCSKETKSWCTKSM